MKKKINICYNCKHGKSNNGLCWCDYDTFDIQEDVSENIVEFEYLPPPKSCPNIFEHIVLAQVLLP